MKHKRLVRADGYAAHHAVQPDCWCVTRDDLQDFRSEVESAVRQGRITPTETDDFHPLDNTYGPSIYTVVQQLIIPVTHLGGCQSWALMRNPEGLRCDLFITHSWAEGVYEFIDKVLNSWPRRCRHAYCCMLSNPQNLDIGDMISCPSGSPFAQALLSSKYMLVVPNRKCSIYSRIWCTYEAYLGYKWHKVIYTASSPISGFWIELVAAFCLMLPSAVMFRSRVDLSKVTSEREHFLIPLALEVFLILLMPWLAPALPMRIMNYLGMFLSAYFAFDVFMEFDHTILCLLLGADTVDLFQVALTSMSVFVAATCAFVASEGDRMYLKQGLVEAALLQQGFTGRVRDAMSTVHQDKVNILLEIAGEESAVDTTIDSLIRASMSTDDLRQAAEKGLPIDSSGTLRVCLATFGWVSWFMNGFIHAFMRIWINTKCLQRSGTEHHGQLRLIAEFVMCGQALAWLLMLKVIEKDSRAFAANCVFKIMSPLAVGMPVVGFWYANAEDKPPCETGLPTVWPVLIFGFITLFVSAFGLGRLTRVPLIGPWIARFILASHIKDLCRLCCPCFGVTAPTRQQYEELGIELSLRRSSFSQKRSSVDTLGTASRSVWSEALGTASRSIWW